MKPNPRLTTLSCLVICMITMSTYSKTIGSTSTSEVIYSSTFPNPPAWSSTITYARGSLVVYMNKVYRAAYITQGDTPRGFGLAPDGPWVYEGHCI